jgi:hypothetical protein
MAAMQQGVGVKFFRMGSLAVLAGVFLTFGGLNAAQPPAPWSIAGLQVPEGACAEQLFLAQLRRLSWKHFGRYAEVFHRAAMRYPEDPVSRGLYIRQHLGERSVGFVAEPGRRVDFSGRRPSVTTATALRVKQHGHVRASLSPVPLLDFNSIVYASRKDVGQALERDSRVQETEWNCGHCGGPVRYRPLRFRPASRLMVSAKHGWTGPYSQGLRMQSILKVLNASHGEDRIAGVLSDEGLYFQSSAVALDQPFHGAGSGAYSLADLSLLLRYETRWDKFLASFGKPLVEIARSASTMTTAQRNFEYSERGETNPLRAMIWIAPVHPSIGLEASAERLFNWTSQSLLVAGTNPLNSQAQWNPLSLSWFEYLAQQLAGRKNAWWKSANPLGVKPTPVLILVGEHDHETSAPTRAWFKKFAERYPQWVEYQEVPGAGHDPLATSEKYNGDRVSVPEALSARARATEVWKTIFRFLRKHVPEVTSEI